MKRIWIAMAIVLASLIAVSAMAQDRPTETKVDTTITAPASAVPALSSPLGKWAGKWENVGRTWVEGQMEIEILDDDGDRVKGRIKATYSSNGGACSVEWESLAGVKNGERLFAQYNLGGRCGKVDAIFSINAAEGIMEGTYRSEYPSQGKFRLTRQ